MADEEAEPHYAGEDDGHPFACTVVLRIAGVLPEEPIRRQKSEADGYHVLLQLKEALRLPEPGLLDRDADVDAILDVDPRTHDEGDHPQHADRGGVTGRRHGAEAVDKI